MDNRKAASRQERRLAALMTEAGLASRPTFNSGAFWTDPGDVRNSMFLIEAKTRNQAGGAKSYTIRKDVWDKLEREAFLVKKIPVYAFSFDNKRDFVILDARDFADLVRRLLDAEAEEA